jgi:histone H3/H4
MAKKAEFIHFNTIKEYISDILKLRSTDKAVENFINRFDTAIEETLKDAGKTTRKAKRKTIMNRDIKAAVKKRLGKKASTWKELSQQIVNFSAAEIGKISKAIDNHLKREK